MTPIYLDGEHLASKERTELKPEEVLQKYRRQQTERECESQTNPMRRVVDLNVRSGIHHDPSTCSPHSGTVMMVRAIHLKDPPASCSIHTTEV